MTDAGAETRRVRIANPLGMHARPAAEFVKLAGNFRADVRLSHDDLSVNGKSIMGVLMLAAAQGTELVIRAEGTDAVEAADALAALVAGGFGEA